MNDARTKLIMMIQNNGYIINNNIAIDYNEKEGLFLRCLKSFKRNDFIFEEEPFYQTFNKVNYTTCNICYKNINPIFKKNLCASCYSTCNNLSKDFIAQKSLEHSILKYGKDSLETTLVKGIITTNNMVLLGSDDVYLEHLGLMRSDVVMIFNNIQNNRFGVFENNIPVHSKCIGTAFFPFICYMNHSCVPNTTFKYTGFGKRKIYAKENIKKFDKITLNYIDVDNITSQFERRRLLFQNYGTKCYCESCLTCFACGSSTSKLLSCGKCSIALYCSKDCQVNDWKCHKKDCKNCM